MSRIQILMTTYRGKDYLQAQLDSIFKQSLDSKDSLSLLIADDASCDGTVECIQKCIQNAPIPVSLIQREKNLGYRGNFTSLLDEADKTADFFAFSDQDDVWHQDKLKRALLALKSLKEEGTNEEKPELYHSNVLNCNRDLKPISKAFPSKISSKMRHALVGNVCMGCTMLFNRSLLLRYQEHRPKPFEIVMHDWWLYLIAASLGSVHYDPEPSMYYRLHGNNVSGRQGFLRRLKRFLFDARSQKGKHIIRIQSQAFFNSFFEDLKPKDYDLIQDFLKAKTFLSRFKAQRKHHYSRQKGFEHPILAFWLFETLYLLGYI